MTDRFAPTARKPRSRLAVAGFLLAVLALVAAVLAGPGYRWGVWELSTAFTLLRWATYGALGGAVVSLAGAVWTRPGARRRGFGFAALGLVIGLVTAYVPWSWKQTADRVPPIHDITTDLGNPPLFVDVLPARADAPNPAEYGGPEIAEQQREAYPELGPLVLDLPPEAAFERALDATHEMGWKIVASVPEEGRIEATDTTFWFGFEDDVVVRIRPADDGGSRIDVRSVSRVGRSDVGTNAARIRAYLDEIRER